MKDYSEFYYLMCGKLLGDGCITKQDGRKPRLQFMHRTEDFGWVKHCYIQLRDYIPLNPPAYKRLIDTRLRNGFSESFFVQSKTDPIITGLYELWYPEGKKKLPFQFIEKYLNHQALAWWYQDDGHLKKVNNTVQKVILSTDSFSCEENSWLIQLLLNKFKLKFSQDGQNRLILYDQFQIIYFLHLIAPFLHESMNRKSLPKQPLRRIAKRTTIYIPSKFKLEKPTREINEKLNLLSTLLSRGNKIVCLEHTFSTFNSLIDNEKERKSYQVELNEKHKLILAKLCQQTGLTISKLTEYCFSI
ncbi:endonuclease [Psychrobacillus sp. L4]|uniref:endonuclease n=1 Tax=Psychrobacillus sp. L4 TaxID=3236892 RepID=UPI0036F377B0